jgi:hypothetical protein
MGESNAPEKRRGAGGLRLVRRAINLCTALRTTIRAIVRYCGSWSHFREKQTR